MSKKEELSEEEKLKIKKLKIQKLYDLYRDEKKISAFYTSLGKA